MREIPYSWVAAGGFKFSSLYESCLKQPEGRPHAGVVASPEIKEWQGPFGLDSTVRCMVSQWTKLEPQKKSPIGHVLETY